MSELLLENRGAVRVLTMNRPDKRNALNFALTEALLEGLRAAGADASVGSIVLTGAGPAFCAGADLSEFKELTPANAPLVERRAELTMQLHGIFSCLSKPVVSAINGAAMGGGAGLALAGDVAVMASSAKLGYPEVKHGIVAAIVMANLVRNVGRKAAFELVATGEPVDAARALALGMVNPSRRLTRCCRTRSRSPRNSPGSSVPPWRPPSAVLPRARPSVRPGARCRPRRQQAHARVRQAVEGGSMGLMHNGAEDSVRPLPIWGEG